MTGPVELRTRELADELMQQTPGLTRQQAKRACRPTARQQVAWERMKAAIEQAGARIHTLAPAFERIGTAARRATRAFDCLADMGESDGR